MARMGPEMARSRQTLTQASSERPGPLEAPGRFGIWRLVSDLRIVVFGLRADVVPPVQNEADRIEERDCVQRNLGRTTLDPSIANLDAENDGIPCETLPATTDG
jgi:hypothetical protein